MSFFTSIIITSGKFFNSISSQSTDPTHNRGVTFYPLSIPMSNSSLNIIDLPRLNTYFPQTTFKRRILLSVILTWLFKYLISPLIIFRWKSCVPKYLKFHWLLWKVASSSSMLWRKKKNTKIFLFSSYSLPNHRHHFWYLLKLFHFCH